MALDLEDQYLFDWNKSITVDIMTKEMQENIINSISFMQLQHFAWSIDQRCYFDEEFYRLSDRFSPDRLFESKRDVFAALVAGAARVEVLSRIVSDFGWSVNWFDIDPEPSTATVENSDIDRRFFEFFDRQDNYKFNNRTRPKRGGVIRDPHLQHEGLILLIAEAGAEITENEIAAKIEGLFSRYTLRERLHDLVTDETIIETQPLKFRLTTRASEHLQSLRKAEDVVCSMTVTQTIDCEKERV